MKKILYLPLLLAACTTNQQVATPLTAMQSIALCQATEQAISQEKKIIAEDGFKRFARHTYRPTVEQRLFGHKIRIISIEPMKNKVYIEGQPREFQHHFSTVLDNIVCAKNYCQAAINGQQTIYIRKPTIKKSKGTTVVECTKAAPQ